jgi:Zn-dependent protease
MSVEAEVAKPEQGVSAIFWLLIAAFAIAFAALAGGETSGFVVFAFVFIGWIISLCLHEWGHAATAWAGGDQSVEERGYLTLNPLRYANPLLSIIMPLIFLAMGGIGFPGGAVYVNTGKLRGPAWRAAVSAAGPAMNLLCLILIGIFFQSMGMHTASTLSPLAAALGLLAFLQATALVLNLLPVPGLDGFGILQAVLPADMRAVVARYSGFVMIAFFVALISAPGLFAPIFGVALWLCALLAIDVQHIATGFDLFRFWEAPADPFAGGQT